MKKNIAISLIFPMTLTTHLVFAGFWGEAWDAWVEAWGIAKVGWGYWIGQGASGLAEWWNSDILPKYELYMLNQPSLPSPKVALVNIDDYCGTRDLLGVKEDDKVFVMLTEDYKYYDADGTERIIPAGFIFDGASVPDFAKYVIQGTPIDPTLLVPGLIHDYMYRCGGYEYNEQIKRGFDLKKYADEMLFVNAYIAGNQNPGSIYSGVRIELPFFDDAGEAFNWHMHHWSDYYSTFTTDYYKKNLELYEKYRDRWTPEQLTQRAGVSIDNDDCTACQIGGKDPNIVDNRKGGSGSGSGGNGGAGSGSGGGGGGGDGSGNGSGTGGGDGAGDPGSGGGTPGEDIDPGYYELPIITTPLPDVILPNGDGTRPWDNIVGFTPPYQRMLYLLSGDVVDPKKLWERLCELFGASPAKNGDDRSDLEEFKKMWDTFRNMDWSKIGNIE